MVSPGYTADLIGTSNELKLKYLADNDFGDLSGDALKVGADQVAGDASAPPNKFVSNRVESAPFSNIVQSNQHYVSDYYVRNASFLKLDKVTLAYQLCDWARVHFTAQNLLTITKYYGHDPEIYGGIDNNVYPRPRTYLLGVNLNF